MITIAATVTRKATTAAQAVAAARGHLAAVAVEGTLEQLSSAVNAVARNEGELAAWTRIEAAMEYATREGLSITEVVNAAAIELAASGADDTWSGRGNDARRARFEGVLHAVSELHWVLS